jgi:TetR/AcrR family transcriptional regulator, lmrAB and yxaGH operons repressor
LEMAKSDSRERFIQSTALLLHERGYSATSMGDIVSASGSPKGSLYFHFPGGKEELAALALSHAGNEVCEVLNQAFSSSKTMAQGLKAVFALFIEGLEQSEFRAGCPVGTVAAEAPDSKQVAEAVTLALQQWHAIVRNRLVQSGLRTRRADELAEFILAAFEGGVLLAKAAKATMPLETTLREILRLLRLENVQ